MTISTQQISESESTVTFKLIIIIITVTIIYSGLFVHAESKLQDNCTLPCIGKDIVYNSITI